MVQSGVIARTKYPDLGKGVFSIPNQRYCKELEDVIAYARFVNVKKLPNEYQLRIISWLINELKINRIWSTRDLVYLFGVGSCTLLDNRDFFTLNFKSPSTYRLVAVNNLDTLPRPYLYNSGFSGGIATTSGVGFRTGWTVGSTPNWTQNNAGFSIFTSLLDRVTSTGRFDIRFSDTNRMPIYFQASTGTNTTYLINRNPASTPTSYANSNPNGYFSVERTSSTSTDLYINGLAVSNNAGASSSLICTEQLVLGFSNNNGTFENSISHVYSHFHLGSSLGASLQKIDNELFAAFRTKLGYQ